MTTLTYLFASKSVAMPMLPLLRAWPDPEASICSSPSWGSPIKGKNIWSIQGPALQAYKSIQGKIRETLEGRMKDLYGAANESSVPHSIDCFMVGRNCRRARPFIVVSCSQTPFCKNVMEVIKSNTWWDQFLAEHLGFGGFILLRQAPR